MRKIALAAAVIAAVASSYTPATAAPGTGPEGRKCSFNSTTDPGTEGGDVQTGQVNAGPLLGTGTVTCTIQVGVSTHNGSDAASASASGTGVTALAPTVVSYVSPEDIPVYLCTQWTDGVTGVTYYWTSGDTPGSGSWGTNAGAECGLAISVEPLEPVNDLIIEYVDKPLCDLLIGLAPGVDPVVIMPDGDVWIAGEFIWDCPPYEA